MKTERMSKLKALKEIEIEFKKIRNKNDKKIF